MTNVKVCGGANHEMYLTTKFSPSIYFMYMSVCIIYYMYVCMIDCMYVCMYVCTDTSTCNKAGTYSVTDDQVIELFISMQDQWFFSKPLVSQWVPNVHL